MWQDSWNLNKLENWENYLMKLIYLDVSELEFAKWSIYDH